VDINKENIDDSLLMQFLLGEADLKDKKRVELWLRRSAGNRLYLDKLEAVWIEAGKLTPSPVAVDVTGAWSRISERIDNYETEILNGRIPGASLRSRAIRFTLRVAAVLVLAFGIYQLVKQPDKYREQVVVKGAVKPVRDTLPDGTCVALNSNSFLTYPGRFGKKSREVVLEGEAFFEVEHDREKPFIIKAGNAVIEVLGTSFNVKAYAGKDVEVTVERGLVRLSGPAKGHERPLSVNLSAGKTGILPLNEPEPSVVEQSFSDGLFWIKRRLVFYDTQLPEVFSLLEDYYHVKIEVADSSILSYRYSSVFENDSIEEILKVIAASFNLELEKGKETYTFKIKGNRDEE